jgi:hypothetical protein
MPAKLSQCRGGLERPYRSLFQLQATASTARTLNLTAVWRRYGEQPAYRERPFFKSSALNRAILVKHRLRRNELEAFGGTRASATKVILPIDTADLKTGGLSFFVGQRGYEGLLEDLALGADSAGRRDAELLRLLDELPSLDPFLMRERLKKHGFAPARFYFELTRADTARMFSFARQELAPLIDVSFAEVEGGIGDKAAKLAQKILANVRDAELDPLRESLSMGPRDFDEGVFCWKGFIYYKWTLADLLPQIRPVMAEISRIQPMDYPSEEERTYIDGARERLNRSIARACEAVRETLKVYDDAYVDLTRNAKPSAFREFLIKAPTLFHQVGERLGSVHHIVSFWRYRFPDGVKPKIGGEELYDLFADFEASLSFEGPGRLAA